MIVVHIPTGQGTGSYAGYCFGAMQRLAADKEALRLEKHIVPKNPPEPADNHCRAVKEAFQSMQKEPEAIHVVCDSDTVVVMADWDIALKQMLETYDCVGTAYQRIGTKQTGFSRYQTYKGKPNVEWMALKPGKPWHLYEPARCNPTQPLMTNTPELQDLYGLPADYRVLQDACWNLPIFLRDNGLTSLAFENIDDPKCRKALAAFPTSYEEWHLPDGTPFVLHQGRSRKNPFRGVPFSSDFYNRCDELIGIRLP